MIALWFSVATAWGEKTAAEESKIREEARLQRLGIRVNLTKTFEDFAREGNPAPPIRAAALRIDEVRKFYDGNPEISKFYSEIGNGLVREKQADYFEEMQKILQARRPELVDLGFRSIKDLNLVLNQNRDAVRVVAVSIVGKLGEPSIGTRFSDSGSQGQRLPRRSGFELSKPMLN